MSQTKTDFAILAPVPGEHLRSALQQVVPHQPYVAFGSQKFDFFRKLDEMRAGRDVPALIYESHEDSASNATFKVAWAATYIGSVESTPEKREDESVGRRPPTVAHYPLDNSSGWATFWRVKDLRQLDLDDRLTIAMLHSYRSGHGWPNGPPRSPVLVERPPAF